MQHQTYQEHLKWMEPIQDGANPRDASLTTGCNNSNK